jgi:RND superfamily putative drug exporter
VASLRLGFPDDASLPDGSTRKAAHLAMAESFGPGANSPLTLAVDLRSATDPEGALREITSSIAAAPGVAGVDQPMLNAAADTAVVIAYPTTGPAEAATTDLVETLRSDVAPTIEASTGASVAITGATALNIDISRALTDALVPFLAVVLGLMVVLLVLAFRSLVIAAKAVAAILLSVGASFGVLVAVFQWGWLAGLIGVDEQIPIISFLPIIMFAILFGLSMDYEVFILSRVKERVTAGDPTDAAVLTGLGSSARVITAAALIMIAVFGSFVFQTDPTIKMFGLGLAVAVLLDATVVRMVFVPAALKLLGDRAWRLPGALDRFVPDLDIEGHRLHRPVKTPPSDAPAVGAGRPDPSPEPVAK